MSSATEIIPNLWLGNATDSQQYPWINQFDIVINCTKDLPFYLENTHCKNIRIPIDDNLEPIEIENMYNCLETIIDYIHIQLLKGKKIFIHCFAGIQRSATVIVAYLLKYTKLSLDECSKCVASKRPIIFQPMCNFRPALDKLVKNINK
jgi:dual specificity MAP kinase phosphatase